MSDEDERFLQHLLATFRVEAEEHLGAMSASLLALERVPPGGDAATLVETLFREAHSLKGAARSVNLPDVERVCQSLERVLAALKRQQLAPSRELADTLHATLDGLGRLLATQGGSGAAPDPEGALALAHALDAWLAGPREASAPAQAAVPVPEAAAAPAPAAADTVRVAIAKLEALMTQAEELDTAKFGIAHVAVGLRAVTQAVVGWKREKDK